MKQRFLAIVFCAALLGLLSALTVQGEGEGCAGIIVIDANATRCDMTAGSSALEDLLNLVIDRIYRQYADASREETLAGSAALEDLLTQVTERIYFQYADGKREETLAGSATLEDLLTQVSEHIYFQYADGKREETLAGSAPLEDLLAQVADRVYLQYADGKREETLVGSAPLKDLLIQVADRVYAQHVDGGRQETLTRPCALLNDATPPSLVGDVTTAQAFGQVTIAWNTDELSSSLVQYGTQPGNYTQSAGDSYLATEHALALSGLIDGQTYYFRVQSSDACDNLFVSGEHSFVYLPQAGLAVAKLASTDVAFSGADLTYTIVISNTGDLTLNATIADDLPAQVTTNDPITWTTALDPGQVWMETVQVTIGDSYTGTLTNVVNVTTQQGLNDGATNVVQVVDPVQACDATIISAHSGDWDDAATWNLNRAPNGNDVVLIRPGHVIVGPLTANVAALCNLGVLESQPFSDLNLTATGFISNTGSILGWNGSAASPCGAPGGNLELRGAPIYNEGVIQAGRGGDGVSCGGAGGNMMVFGRNTTNHGTMCAGAGGNVTGTGSGQAGNGGHAHIWGKYGGTGFLLNDGLACAGDGGDGNPVATQPQHGGCGGTLKLISLPSVFLSGGAHYAGFPGLGTGAGQDGCYGNVIIEPSVIDLSGNGTEVIGGNILIFGGDDWTLDLSSMSGAAISATQRITLAVGSLNGTVDLRGNAQPVFHAGEQVTIASDVVELDAGITLNDLTNAPTVTTLPAQILYDASLTGPKHLTANAGEPLDIPLTLLNSGPTHDTYSLTVTDAAGWGFSGLPATLTIDGLAFQDLVLQTMPAGNDVNIITITATSQNDPTRSARLEIAITVIGGDYLLYLPAVAAPP